MGAEYLAETGALRPQFATSSDKGIVGEAPRLDLSETQMSELFDAANNRKALSLKAVDSDAAPMSQAPDVRLSPYTTRREGLRILDLLPVTSTTQPSLWYYRQTTAASAASVVGEGLPKPQSTLEYERIEAPIRKIAHFAELTQETLDDFPAFRSTVETDMVAGLINEENHQLLSGSGAGLDLTGLLNTSGVITRANGAETNLETLFLAITDLRVGASFTEPTGIITHPTTFANIRLTKDDQSRYLAGDPLSSNPTSLWGYSCVVTTQCPVGTAIVANFTLGTQVYLREAPRFEVNPMAETAWKSNKVLVLAEERLTLTVPRPSAIVKVTGLV